MSLKNLTEAAEKNRVKSHNLSQINSDHIFYNGKGNFISENSSCFTYKVNEVSAKDLKEAKNKVNNIKKHYWDNGSKKGFYETTNNNFLKYDSKGSKNDNNNLNKENKSNLMEARIEFGKEKVPFITTQFNSYLPYNNIQTVKNVERLKNSSIDFNPNFRNINRLSVYSSDY
jgi:hypothetical protein